MKKRRHYRGGYQFSGQKALARELRKNQTAAEELLWRLLRNRRLLGFKFRRQHQFGDYIVDFYCREANLVIECDGAAHEPNEGWHHDQERDAFMISQGLKVLRFSNDRVLADTANVIDEICESVSLSRKGIPDESDRQRVVMQFECRPRILRVIHGRDARVTSKLDHYPRSR